MSKGRADHNSLKSSYQKAKNFIFNTQSICGICGRPVDFSKSFPDPWSPTIDHIIPVSKGGAPTSIDNMQLAHSWCNRQKSTKVLKFPDQKPKVDNRDLPLSCNWFTLFDDDKQ